MHFATSSESSVTPSRQQPSGCPRTPRVSIHKHTCFIPSASNSHSLLKVGAGIHPSRLSTFPAPSTINVLSQRPAIMNTTALPADINVGFAGYLPSFGLLLFATTALIGLKSTSWAVSDYKAWTRIKGGFPIKPTTWAWTYYVQWKKW